MSEIVYDYNLKKDLLKFDTNLPIVAVCGNLLDQETMETEATRLRLEGNFVPPIPKTDQEAFEQIRISSKVLVVNTDTIDKHDYSRQIEFLDLFYTIDVIYFNPIDQNIRQA